MGPQGCTRITRGDGEPNTGKGTAARSLALFAALSTLAVLAVVGTVSVAVLRGAPSAAAQTSTTPPTTQDSAYWMAARDGAVYSFGGAPNDGSLPSMGIVPRTPIVGMTADTATGGYWLVASDGGVFSFGAPFYGSTGAIRLAKPVVGMAATVTEHGYWLVASDGGVFSFGAARFHGSVPGLPITLKAPIVGMAAMPTGTGYWLVASDGGIFTFGGQGTKFYGSTGALALARPIVGMATMPTATGYWLVASDGGIFTFGAHGTKFYGSLGDKPTPYPVVGMSTVAGGGGYWLTNANGGVTNFGRAVYWGSAPQHIPSPIVGMATAVGDGDPGSTSFQSGSYGYDVSQYQCGQTLPSTHQIGVVEVEGWAFGSVNPCLAQEATWAAGGLNLYTFLAYGTSTTYEPGCAGNATAPDVTACNFGYAEAMNSYDAAVAAIGGRVSVPWWVDVETANWTPTTAANRSVVVGAYDALRYGAGINTVGFYLGLSSWNGIVGQYNNPAAPLFPAWWTGPTPGYKCSHFRTVAITMNAVVPAGPIELVQYTDVATGRSLDGDYAC